jgi:hypothetical protein
VSELQRARNNRAKWNKLYPIPSRMPRSCKLPLDFDPYSQSSSPITFVDDGSSHFDLRKSSSASKRVCNFDKIKLVEDAYAQLNIGPSDSVYKTTPFGIQLGVDHILENYKENDDSYGDEKSSPDQIIRIPWKRVVISSIKAPLAQSGLMVGDVVTHVDGEQFDGNAENLKHILAEKLIQERARGGDGTPHEVQIVVNAEMGCAETLRLRSLAAESLSNEK